MEKAERDRILVQLSQEESGTYRQILHEIGAEAKSQGGQQINRRKQILDSRAAAIDPNVFVALDAVAQRDATGPNEGDTPPDFELKRLHSEETVRLSSFKGKRPVALIFGSYT